MPIRKTPLVNEEYYHVFNRSIDKQPIFIQARATSRAINTIQYYQATNPPISYSRLLDLTTEARKNILEIIKKKDKSVDIICYCLMPNHYHFLLKQNVDRGISEYLRKFQISYTRYFNLKSQRIGHLFLGPFKVVRVEDDSQLLHLSRYIHLNPYTSFVVKNLDALREYKWSSLNEYLNTNIQGICNKIVILNQFGISSSYERFTFDNADYERSLEKIKHLALDNKSEINNFPIFKRA